MKSRQRNVKWFGVDVE